MTDDDARLPDPANQPAVEPASSSRLPLGVRALVFARDRGIVILWLLLLDRKSVV